MPAFKQLSEVDLERLVRQIRRFESQKPNANRPPHEALAAVDVPDWKVDPTALVEEGKNQFVRFGCAGCHRTSHEAESRVFADSTGQLVRARDFLTEPLRRGNDPQEILLRILVGMPGTPHPQLSVADTDLRPLVFYIRSLLPNEYPSTTNHSRRLSVSLQR